MQLPKHLFFFFVCVKCMRQIVVVLAMCLVVHGYVGRSPLSPSLECSACQVTAHELVEKYNSMPLSSKFAKTEVEVELVLEGLCSSLTPRYRLGQESFGSHLKVFCDNDLPPQKSQCEPADFYSESEEQRYLMAPGSLITRCEELLGRFDEEVAEWVIGRAPMGRVKFSLCHKLTDVCDEKRIEKYRQKEEKRRAKWTRQNRKEEIQEKLRRELNTREDDLQE